MEGGQTDYDKAFLGVLGEGLDLLRCELMSE